MYALSLAAKRLRLAGVGSELLVLLDLLVESSPVFAAGEVLGGSGW